MTYQKHFDVLVIGSGPAGQKSAIQAAKANKSVLLVEQEVGLGGACVYRGTIPSKTLRETAVSFSGFQKRTEGVIDLKIPDNLQLASLMSHMDKVIQAHGDFMTAQIDRNKVEKWHGKARFHSANEIEVQIIRGEKRLVSADIIVIATGSRPRTPDDIPVDHEHILDSDSILSLLYLPKSLTVLGSGIVASEYATIFGSLGVQVTMVDKYDLPLGFLDPELSQRFTAHFREELGCKFYGGVQVEEVSWNGVDAVETRLSNGQVVRSEKMLCAQGRVANVDDLGLESAGLAANSRGLLDVNAHCQTLLPHVYAVGDVIGPPALAASSMEQGRRALCHALGLPVSSNAQDLLPMGIYTIPEMASIGLTHGQATEKFAAALVGRAEFSELARGQIACSTDGFLKLVSDDKGEKVLGVQILGEGATELIHVGQMAMMGGQSVQTFVENIFNFPTLAEAYRVAALDVLRQCKVSTKPSLV